METMQKFNGALDDMVARCKWTKRREAARKASKAKEYYRNAVELNVDNKLVEIYNYLEHSSLPSYITSEYNSIKSIYLDKAAALCAVIVVNREIYVNHPESFIDDVFNTMEVIFQKAQEVKPRVDALYRAFKIACRTTRNEYRTTPSMSKNDDECLLI